MNHLAEPGLKGARAEARASCFYFIPPQRIDGAALAALYLLIVMDPQKNYSLTNSLRLVNRGKRSICPCSYPSYKIIITLRSPSHLWVVSGQWGKNQLSMSSCFRRGGGGGATSANNICTKHKQNRSLANKNMTETQTKQAVKKQTSIGLKTCGCQETEGGGVVAVGEDCLSQTCVFVSCIFVSCVFISCIFSSIHIFFKDLLTHQLSILRPPSSSSLPHLTGRGILLSKRVWRKIFKFWENPSILVFSKIGFHNRTSPNSRINQMHCDMPIIHMSSIEVNDKKVRGTDRQTG